MCEKVLAQAIHMLNMKALSQSVERELKFIIFFIKVGQRSKSRSPGINEKVLSQAIHMLNMKALSQSV